MAKVVSDCLLVKPAIDYSQLGCQCEIGFLECCRGLVHALPFGGTFVMGLITGLYCEKWARTVTDPPPSSCGPAPMLEQIQEISKAVTFNKTLDNSLNGF